VIIIYNGFEESQEIMVCEKDGQKKPLVKKLGEVYRPEDPANMPLIEERYVSKHEQKRQKP
jgi:hypothetical protein